MGYRGFLRSLSAASNAASRANAAAARARQKAEDKVQKKIGDIALRKEKIVQALHAKYAAGKISKERFDQLSKRVEDIETAFLALGKSAAVELGKRYVCGDIDKEQFDLIKRDILPVEYWNEEEAVKKAFQDVKAAVQKFRDECAHKGDGTCQKCGSRKGFFNRIHEYQSMCLCSACVNLFRRTKVVPAFIGKYLSTKECTVEASDDKPQANLDPDMV